MQRFDGRGEALVLDDDGIKAIRHQAPGKHDSFTVTCKRLTHHPPSSYLTLHSLPFCLRHMLCVFLIFSLFVPFSPWGFRVFLVRDRSEDVEQPRKLPSKCRCNVLSVKCESSGADIQRDAGISDSQLTTLHSNRIQAPMICYLKS